MEDLTIREKVGQMLMVGLDGNTITDRIKNLILNYKISGVILYRKNFNTYEDMCKLIRDLKELNSVNKFPLFIALDQEGGRVNRMPPEFHNILNAYKLAEKKDIEIIQEAGNVTGEMLYKSGYNMNFSPVLDVLGKTTSEAIGNRCYGNNAKDVSRYGVEIMKQLQKNKVISVVKHFPGQGEAKKDSHYFLPSIKRIKDENIKPFISAIENGADALMVGHLIVKNISRIYPASLSEKMVKRIRLKYNFKGVIMTDDLKMKSVRYIFGPKLSLRRAVLVGNDLILFRFNKRDEITAIENLIRFVEMGKIKEKRIDRSVKRILKLKAKYELDDKKIPEKCNIEAINNRIDYINSRAQN